MTEPARPAVHDLQAMAQSVALAPRRIRSRFSRAARLDLIDRLSRWAGGGLALIAGVAIFIAVSAGRVFPFRAIIWTVLMIAALAASRRLLRQFRFGERSSAHPFRWRANYTSALAVLSAAFGAGAVIVLPAGAPDPLVGRSLGLFVAAIVGAAAVHAPHGRTAAAACLPGAVFIVFAAWRTGGAGATLWTAGLAAVGAAGVFLFNRYLRELAIRRFPRSALNRAARQAAFAAGAKQSASG